MTKRLKDIVKTGTLTDVEIKLASLENSLNTLGSRIRTNLKRNELNLVLHNLVVRSAFEVARLKKWIQESIELPAWCARNLFELNLILRFVLQSEENLKNWMGQLATDEIQILEGILELAEEKNDPRVKILNERITEIRRLGSKHKIELKPPIPISGLASKVGMQSEYRAFFKLYSKYVHPSSWIVNGPKERIDSLEYWNTFVIQAQIYATDTYERVSEKAGFKKYDELAKQ